MVLGTARCCSVLLGAARCCSVLLDAALRCLMAITNVGRATEHFFCMRFSFDAKFRIPCYICTDSMGHSAGAHETLEMLDGMLDSFDHTEAEQHRARL